MEITYKLSKRLTQKRNRVAWLMQCKSQKYSNVPRPVVHKLWLMNNLGSMTFQGVRVYRVIKFSFELFFSLKNTLLDTIDTVLSRFSDIPSFIDCLCGLVDRVPGYRSGSPGSIPCATRFSEKYWVWNGVHSVLCVQLRSYLEEIVVAPV
jgi:hypothetical protein